MTSIEQQAAEVIREARLSAPRVRGMDDTVSPHIAQALAEAGLLKDDTELNRIKQELTTLRDGLSDVHENKAWDTYESGMNRGLRMFHDHIVRILGGGRS